MTRAPLMTRTVPTTPGPPEGFASAGLGSQPGPGTGGAVPEDRLSGPASALEESMVAALNAEVLARGDATGLVDAAYTLMPSPMGELVVVVTDRGLLRIGFDTEELSAVLTEVAEAVGPVVVEDSGMTRTVVAELGEYFAGERRSFDIALDLRLTRGFRAEVQQALADIPFGSTMSYAEMAAHLGNPKAVRAVGTACAKNPIPLILPCHRIVRSDGSFGNYRGGHDRKQWVLDFEAGTLPLTG